MGLNYYGDSRDRRNKEKVANLPITLFCIHGNHERRPTTIAEYKLHEWKGGKVWVEDAYPNILFRKAQAEIYEAANCSEGSLIVIFFFTKQEEIFARNIIKSAGYENMIDESIFLIDCRKDNKKSASIA